MAGKHDARLYELAKLGATQQFRDLIHEAKLLVDLFPHLRDAFDQDELPIRFIVATGNSAPATNRRRSAAGRKAVGVRVRKDWALRRKVGKTTS